MVGLLLLMVMLVITACAPAPTPGPAEREIKVGFFASLTGPAATSAIPLCDALFDHLRLTNEQGGIDGIKIKVQWRDTAHAIPETLTAYKAFREQGIMVGFTLCSGCAEVLSPLAQRDHFFIVVPDLTEPMITKPYWMVNYCPGMQSLYVTFIKWIRDNWTETRPPRIGFIILDWATGWDSIKAIERCKELGIDIDYLGREVVPVICVDTSTEWLRMAGKKPDWVFVQAFGSTHTVLIKDAARLGIQEKGIKIGTWHYGVGAEFFRIVGGEQQGWYGLAYFPYQWDDFPERSTMVEAAKKYRGRAPEDLGSTYVAGWYNVKGMIAGLRAAIEKVGFENLTAEAIREATITFDLRQWNGSTCHLNPNLSLLRPALEG